MKYIKQKIRLYGLFLLLGPCILFSCSKEDKIKEQPVIHAGTADSVNAYPGKNRIQLSWLVSDPEQTKKAAIYWGSSDSIEIPFQGPSDSMGIILTGLQEGQYAFDIYLYDEAGHVSRKSMVIAKVYGDQYRQSLVLKTMKGSTFYDETNVTLITWKKPGPTAIGKEVNYTDMNDSIRSVFVPRGTDTTRLEHYKAGSSFRYRTVCLPEPEAIDTFYTDYQTVTAASGSLKDIAESKNILIGSLISYGSYGPNVTDGVINDWSPNGIYTEIAKREFNLGQAAWGATRWHYGSPSDFREANAVVNWCKSNNKTVELIGIVGPDNYMPSWFNDGSFTPHQMDSLLRSLVYEIMESNNNKSKVDVWCVANELFKDDGTYRNMKWNEMGWETDASGLTGEAKINAKHPVFIGKALQYCRDKTDALLEIRDFYIANNDPSGAHYKKYEAMYQLIKHLQAKGDPINCVGIQAHMKVGEAPAGGLDAFKSSIEKYRQEGMEVHLTELDESSNKLLPWSDQYAQQQKEDYYHLISTALEAGVKLISFWGIRDNNDPNWRVDQHPLIFDHEYNKKPAYYGTRQALFDAKE